MRSRFIALVSAAGLVLAAASAQSPMQEWPVYAADAAATHYSPLTDIDRSNVSQLAVAWEWKTGDDQITAPARRAARVVREHAADDRQRAVRRARRTTASSRSTPRPGRELWAFDPKAYEDGQPPNGTGFVHRGVAAWRDGDRLRIFMNSRAKLFCLDAKTGEPVDRFGDERRRRSDEGPAVGGRSEAATRTRRRRSSTRIS